MTVSRPSSIQTGGAANPAPRTEPVARSTTPAREPGLVITLHRPEGPSPSTSSGYASIEHEVRADQETMFNLASVSKQFTATCAVLLHLQGHLDLDADVRRTVPELQFSTPFSLRQCLSHTAGLPDVLGLIALTGASVATFPDSRSMLQLLSGLRELESAPGTYFSYSNSGYIIAAAVIERVTGLPFADASRQLIFEPLGMSRTRFFTHPGETIPRAATGYVKASEGWRRADLLEFATGAGGASSCSVDMHCWQQFLVDGHVLGREARDRLLEPTVLTDGQKLPYALGTIHEQRTDGQHLIGHGGAIRGFRSHVLTDLVTGIGVTVLANRDDIIPADIARQALLQESGAAEQPVAASPGQSVVPSSQALRSVCAHWWCGETDETLAITAISNPEPAGTISVVSAWGETPFRPVGAGVWSSGPERVTLSGDRLTWRGEVGEQRDYQRLRSGWHTEPSLGKRLIGSYWCSDLRTSVEIANDDGSLVASFGLDRPAPLVAAAPGLFRCGAFTIRLTEGGDLAIGGYGNSNRGRLIYRRFHAG